MSFNPVSLCLPPELFELVLAKLPMRCLLTTAQLVCRHWRDTISSAPALQQKLFFSPLPETTTRRAIFQLNPLLQEVFPLWFQSHCFPHSDDIAGHVFDDLELARRPSAFLRKGASWRKMLVQQPPAPALGIVQPVLKSIVIELEKGWADFEDEGGLRMGPLYDLVLSQGLGAEGYSFQFIWWRLPPSQILEPVNNQKTRDVVNRMLEEVDVVLQIQRTYPRGNVCNVERRMKWWKRFKSEDYDVIDVVFDDVDV
jgi:hypothetical protein